MKIAPKKSHSLFGFISCKSGWNLDSYWELYENFSSFDFSWQNALNITNCTEQIPHQKTRQFSEKYYNLLENHPDSTITISNRDFNLASDLLDRIGKYFYNKKIFLK